MDGTVVGVLPVKSAMPASEPFDSRALALLLLPVPGVWPLGSLDTTSCTSCSYPLFSYAAYGGTGVFCDDVDVVLVRAAGAPEAAAVDAAR